MTLQFLSTQKMCVDIESHNEHKANKQATKLSCLLSNTFIKTNKTHKERYETEYHK